MFLNLMINDDRRIGDADSMNSNKIPPPPPPPTEYPKNVRKEVSLCSFNRKWEEELQDGFRIVNQDGKYSGSYVYNHVDSIIQQGPT